MDAYGGIPPNTVQYVLNPLINRVKNFVPPNWAAPTAKAYWYQRLSVTLWTFNAYKVKPLSGILLLKQHTNKTEWTFCSHIH